MCPEAGQASRGATCSASRMAAPCVDDETPRAPAGMWATATPVACGTLSIALSSRACSVDELA